MTDAPARTGGIAGVHRRNVTTIPQHHNSLLTDQSHILHLYLPAHVGTELYASYQGSHRLEPSLPFSLVGYLAGEEGRAHLLVTLLEPASVGCHQHSGVPSFHVQAEVLLYLPVRD